MAIPVVPPTIPRPIAEAGDIRAIPDTTPAGTNQLSFQSGFPPTTSSPLAAGGIPPQREDFNAALLLLSQHTFFQQSGGVYPWSADLDYLTGNIILGSNAKLYQSTAPSGPGTEAGPQDPVSSSGYWEIASLTPAMINDSSLGFPSDTYVDIPWGANNMTYTAPADGWVAASRGSTASLQWIYVQIPSINIYVQSVAVGTGTTVPVAAPVAKGQTAQISWTLGGSPNFLRFIPARKVS